MKVCHFTSVHPWNDTRVFYKECVSLAKHGYDISLVSPSGPTEKINNVNVISANVRKRGKYGRILLTTFKVYKVANKVNADIYHFHDFELFLAGIIFRLKGKKVIFDIHENMIEQIRAKDWGHIFKPIFYIITKIINVIASKYFKLILAENSYANIYDKLKADYVTVLNYPDVSSLEHLRNIDRSNENGIFYMGSISKARNIDNMLKALNILDKKGVQFFFHCIGPLVDNLETEVIQSNDYKQIKDKIKFYGRLDLYKGYELSTKCKVGLAVLKPIGNYVNSYPTKIFEYMSIGLPVITSNFPLYQEVVEKFECGLCVASESPEEIAEAIEKIFNDQSLANDFAKNAVVAAKSNFNWKNEADKLCLFYERILN